MDIATLARKGGKRIVGLPSVAAARVISWPNVSARLDASYRAAQARYRTRLPELSATDAVIVDALRRHGLFITTLDALGLPGSAAMLASGQALAGHYAGQFSTGAMRYRDAFQAGSGDVLRHREIFTWGLAPRLLDIVENYLGLPAGYDGINVFYTRADGREVAARKWHLDVEDRRMVKVAVYFNDVDGEGGPLQILRRNPPRAEATRPVMTQDMLERAFGGDLRPEDVVSCTGPAGTVIVADTARLYHRGKPAITRDRCAVFYNYVSRQPLRPFFCERGTLSRAEVTAVAAGLEPRQREALLWRRDLPLLARMIPPAPIG